MSNLTFSTVSLYPKALDELQAATTVQEREAALHDMDSMSGIFHDYLAKIGGGDPELAQACDALREDMDKIIVPFEHADITAGTYDVPAHHADNLPMIVGALSSYIHQEIEDAEQDEEYMYGADDQDSDWWKFVAELEELESMVNDVQEAAESSEHSIGELWLEAANCDGSSFSAALALDLPDTENESDDEASIASRDVHDDLGMLDEGIADMEV